MSVSLSKLSSMFAVLGLLSMAFPALAEGDPAAGETKGQTCMGCHGIKGYNNVYPTFHVPKLVGQHPEYILAALKAYRSGERPHPTMTAQATSMTDQDMEDIAAWLGSLGKD